MASENGDRETRLDRIEHAIDAFASDHENFRKDHELLMDSLRIQRNAIMELLRTTEEHTKQLELEAKTRREVDAAIDKRVDNLVSAIGEYISRLPPLSPAQN